MGQERYTVAQVISAIQGTFGIKTAAAKELHCTRQTIDNYIKRHPTVAQAYQEERERLVDLAESKFAQEISKGEWQAISFALRTLGKDRGYVERRQVEASGREGGPISISLETASFVRQALERKLIQEDDEGPEDSSPEEIEQ